MVDSPCVKLCKLNPNGVCVGCGRTGEEIGAWSSAPERRKAEIVEAAKKRLKALAPASGASAQP